MNQLKLQSTSLIGLHLIRRSPICDHRGHFERLFCEKDLEVVIGDRRIVQINYTHTRKCGTVRGLHFQNPPNSEMKFVSCIKGKVFDIAVDLRKGSDTFLKWHGEILSQENHLAFCIPEGFAHGFQTLTDDCELIYFHTTPFAPESEAGLNALDPKLSISWPLPISTRSERDMNHMMLTEEFLGL